MLLILFSQSGLPSVVIFPPTVGQESNFGYTRESVSSFDELRDTASDLGFLRNRNVDFVGRQ